MKKNSTMRVAALLLALTLMTSCFVGGTFAKYTTGNDGFDEARVAKFGVTVEIDDTMFSDAYQDVLGDVTWTTGENSMDITVQAKDQGDKVVAPGTKGSLAGFTVAGTPEVDVEVTYTATLTLTGWFLDANNDGIQDPGEEDYCPLIITVNSTPYYVGMGTVTIDGTDYDVSDVAGLKAAVEAAIVDSYAYYHTNTNLDSVGSDLSVAWEWEYEQHVVPSQDDVFDTKLGEQAANDKAATIKLEVGMTITQVN